MLKLQDFFQYPNFINERQFLLCTENVHRNILTLLKYWSWYHFKCTLRFGIITKALLFGIKPSYKVINGGQFFLSRFFFTDADGSQDSRRRKKTIIYPTLPLTPTHEHSDIYLQLWPLVFTRLLLDEIYHFIQLPFD